MSNTVKIAVASDKKMVAGHFGHCETFEVFNAEGSNITSSESHPNPGHKPGFLPNFLNDMGVKVIISGGMGAGAVDIFNEKGIKVVIGAKGDAKEVAQSFLNNNLEAGGNVCNHKH